MQLSLNSRLVLADLKWYEYYLGTEVAVCLDEIIEHTEKNLQVEGDSVKKFSLVDKKVLNTLRKNEIEENQEKKVQKALKQEQYDKRKQVIATTMKVGDVKVKLKNIRISRSVELTERLKSKERCANLGDNKINVTHEYIQIQKQKANDWRNEKLEEKSRQNAEKLEKARGDLDRKKLEFRIFNKEKVGNLEKGFLLQTKKRKSNKVKEIEAKEKTLLPSLKKKNIKIWDLTLKGMIGEQVNIQHQTDFKFQRIMKILMSSDYYMNDWENMFNLVFDKFVRLNFVSINDLRIPKKLYHTNKEEELKEIISPKKKRREVEDLIKQERRRDSNFKIIDNFKEDH